MKRVWIYLIIGIGLTALLVYLFSSLKPQVLADRDTQISLVQSLLLLAMVGSALLVRGKLPNIWEMIRAGTIWVLFGLLLILGYSHKALFLESWHRIKAELAPGRVIEAGPQEALVKARGSQFIIDAQINGIEIPLLFDTGASHVALSLRDALRMGLNPNKLDFSQTIQTANGLGRAAPIWIKEIRIGKIVVRNVRGSVNETPLPFSLLGASFLSKLSHYSVNGSLLTMRK